MCPLANRRLPSELDQLILSMADRREEKHTRVSLDREHLIELESPETRAPILHDRPPPRISGDCGGASL